MKTMLCCSTFNQTTNYIPIIHKNIDFVIILTTTFAKQQHYTQRLVQILDKKNIKYKDILVPKEVESDFNKLSEFIINILDEYKDLELYINIGGGYKIFTLSMYNAFLKTSSTIIYTEPNTSIIIELSSDIKQSSEKIEINATMSEILTLYGYKTTGSETKYNQTDLSDNMVIGKKMLKYYLEDELFRKLFIASTEYKQGIRLKEKDYLRKFLNELAPNLHNIQVKDQKYEKILNNFEKVNKLLGNNSFLNSFYNDLKDSKQIFKIHWDNVKKEIINYVQKRLNEIEVDEELNFPVLQNLSKKEIQHLKDIFRDIDGKLNISSDTIYKKDISYKSKQGEVFEWLVTAAVANLMENNDEIKEKINEMYINVKTIKENSDSTNPEAEYDIVLVTKTGRLIMIEVKSGTISGDTAKSKDYGAYQKSGPYGKSLIVTPIVDQLKDESNNFHSYVPNLIKNLPSNILNFGSTHVQLDKIVDAIIKYS
jgi:hypothetical protein